VLELAEVEVLLAILPNPSLLFCISALTTLVSYLTDLVNLLLQDILALFLLKGLSMQAFDVEDEFVEVGESALEDLAVLVFVLLQVDAALDFPS
jgi:hypothetical protein